MNKNLNLNNKNTSISDVCKIKQNWNFIIFQGKNKNDIIIKNLNTN